MSKDLRDAVRRGVSALVAVSALTLVRVASATDEFPQFIADYLDMPCPPGCGLCHKSEAGGDFPLKRFGGAMQATGMLVKYDSRESVQAALDRLTGDSCSYSLSQARPDDGPCDSDGDTVPDVEQLRQGRNPNTGDVYCDVNPRYGCGARVARSDWDVDGTSLLIAGATALVLARGFRRKR